MKSLFLTKRINLSNITGTNVSRSFAHKMAAKTSWHRYGTKLRYCHPMYWFDRDGVFFMFFVSQRGCVLWVTLKIFITPERISGSEKKHCIIHWLIVFTVAHKCRRPENPQHDGFKLLCCGFSGRWHFWVTVVCVVLWVRPQHNSSVLLCCLKAHNTTT